MQQEDYKYLQKIGTVFSFIFSPIPAILLLVFISNGSFGEVFIFAQEHPIVTLLMLAGPLFKYGLYLTCKPKQGSQAPRIRVSAPAFDCSGDCGFWEKAVGTSNYNEELHSLGTGLCKPANYLA